jgi:arabinose-5-phosphate isomerase
LNSKINPIEIAKQVFKSESESIADLSQLLNQDFTTSCGLLHECLGRVVVTGVGKSALIAQKMVATFNSTGTPALFLHATEAIHGDLGMVQKGDAVICISKSGNSPEIKVLLGFLLKFGNPIIAITGNTNSFLAKKANFVLDTTVKKESCPLNLAPTNSTTAQLVMGDALAVCLMKLKNFKDTDFAKYHPGGTLGKKLTLRVKNMMENSLKPRVTTDASIKQVIFEISEKRLGVTAVLEGEKLVGIITDGDIRRMLTDRETFTDLKAEDIMTKNPKIIQSSDLVIDAFNIMEDFSITQLIVVDKEAYVGVLHLHDILKEGIV